MRTGLWWRLELALVAVLAGCGDDGSATGDTDPGTSTSSGGDTGDDAVCEPVTCLDIDQACGRYDDGCGGAIDCEAGCACTPQTADQDCPVRPCEEVAGCVDSKCEYAPVTCGEAACTCRGDECEEWTLRSCGEIACSQFFCDPRPTFESGSVRYENECVAAPMVGACGICGLGAHICEPEPDTLTCRDLDLVEFLGVNPDAIECDSTLPASSFVFVDSELDVEVRNGSRSAPYRTYEDAIATALAGDAVAIIIAGSPVLRSRPIFSEGISVLGGFDGAPHYRANPDNRPVFEIGREHMTDEELAERRVVGGFVRDVEQPTLLANFDIRTEDLSEVVSEGAGWSNHGLVVNDSPGLRIVRVNIEAGDAGHGAPGAHGDQGTSGLPGAPGDPGEVCDCTAPGPDTWGSCVGQVLGGLGAATSLCLGEGSLTAGGAGRGPSPSAPNCVSYPGDDAPGGASGGNGGLNIVNPGVGGSPASQVPPLDALPGLASLYPVLTPDGPLFRVPSTASGFDGVIGAAGFGGGGGSSGIIVSQPFPGCTTSPDNCNQSVMGAGGGGGGGGGCGGDAGLGGAGGGSSVALSVSNSSGMIVEDCSFIAGAAGNGGDGGDGGAGGLGGAFGGGGIFPAAQCPGSPQYDCVDFNAGDGGSGGTGGPGGRGGNGGGGSAFGAYCIGSGLTVRGTVSFSGQTAGEGGTAGSLPGQDGVAVNQFRCRPVCGNGVKEAPEHCDDGNTEDGDGCESDCRVACGGDDGAVMAAFDPTSGACLAAFNTVIDWSEAEVTCANLGGHLASFTNPAEQAIASLLRPNRSFHVGLSDQIEEGVYAWQTGEELGDTDWCSGAPYGGTDRNCVLAFWSDVSAGHCWLDVPCDQTAPYVCEY